MAVQLELFCDNSEESILRRRVDAMQESLDKQRKRQFAMINNLSKELITVKEELHQLRFAIQAID